VDNFEMTNPAFPNNPFPTIAKLSGNSGNRFQTLFGTGSSNVFIVSGGGSVTRNANVWSAGSFKGVGNGTGLDALRIRLAGINIFSIRAYGQCRNLTVWYRIPSLGTQWRLAAASGWLPSATSTDVVTDLKGIVVLNKSSISVASGDTIEFGYNGMDGFGNADATDANNDIYAGTLEVDVLNY
jgi:hypothetical protein